MKAKVRNTIAVNHNCPKNHDGSSKSMEADACLIMTSRLYNEKEVSVEAIVADDDSTMKAIVRHSYKKKRLVPTFPSLFIRSVLMASAREILDCWIYIYQSQDGSLIPHTGRK